MKRFIPTACLAAAFAVGLSAQTPSPAQEPQAAGAAGGGKNVTVTGCLKAGDEPGSYALSNIKPAAKDAPSATSPSPAGTTGTTGAAASKDLEGISSLKLTGSPAGANLSEHVGHTVRISGALSAASPSAGAAAGAPSAAGAAAGAAKASPSLEVSSVSMVSGSCSQ